MAGVITLVLVGIALLPPSSATASQPPPTITATVTTSAGSPELVCRLVLGQDCVLVNRLDMAALNARSLRNPAIGARNVPTYTQVAATFGVPVNPASLTPNSFYLSQGNIRVAGQVDYIELSQMAVFSPVTPLAPNTTYTVTVAAGVLDTQGQSLTTEWSFTTAPQPGLSSQDDVSLAGSNPTVGGMQIYFGDLHSHTSYSDGSATPAQAFASARASGVDFFAVTEHAFMLNETEWQDLRVQADVATINNQFVGLAGYEYSHGKGHLNVFDTDTVVRFTDPLYANLQDFYAWLVNHPTAFAQFNHPNENGPDSNFNNFAFLPEVDQKIVLQELVNAPQFFLSLNSGWHLGSLKNRDTHSPNWGCCPLMGLVASSLSREAILEALRARRTFFVSPNDSNLALVIRANGYWMGSAIPNTSSLNFAINAFDPDPDGRALTLVLYENGRRVASKTLSARQTYSWNISVPANLGKYYYVEAFKAGWLVPAYSSPVWVERPPIANAGDPQLVAPGMEVTLNGGQSWDPDNDALAFNWSQQSGPTVPLTPNRAKATFIAPNYVGDIDFQLTVIDTGGLKSSDSVRISVTDLPFLQLSKTGPETAEPGELITYTLSVTNIGATEAVGVVITDAVPRGATHISGGALMPGNIVSWTVANLAAGGGSSQLTFVVTTSGAIANIDYRASCTGCIPAKGGVSIFTNGLNLYLPVIRK